jgi:hypothetical protein
LKIPFQKFFWENFYSPRLTAILRVLTPLVMVRYAEDIYSDYLYDCYIANQRLTDEDWHYYGKELHHTEIPACMGGVLNPLNSQELTTYQHWMAGVLQSEVVGTKCFFAPPPNSMPPLFEMLRSKWIKKHNSESGRKGGAISGRQNAESGRLKQQASAAGKEGVRRTNSIQMQCTVTGRVMNPGNLTRYQRRNNIDTSNRIRLN